MRLVPPSRIKLIPRYLFFWLFLIFFKFGAGLQYTLIPPLGARVLPIWVVGVVIFASTIFQMILDIPVGYLLDKFGYKKMLIIGTAVSLVGVLVFLYGITIETLVLSTFLVALGWTIWMPGVNAYSLSESTKRTSTAFMAYRDIFASAGMVLTAMLLILVVNSSAFIVAVALSLPLAIALILIYLAPKDKKRITADTAPSEDTSYQKRRLFEDLSGAIHRLNPASSLLLMLNCASGIFYGIVWFVVPLLVASTIYNGALLSAGLAMFDFTVIIMGSYLSKTLRKTQRKLILIGLLIFSVSGFLLGTSFGILFIVFSILSSAGNEMTSLPLWVWMHALDSKHNRDGLISGLLTFSGDIGWAVGPLLAGVLYETVGPTLSISIGALPIAFVFVLYYLAVRQRMVKIPIFDAPPKPHTYRHKS
jgi:MFS family permease